jgi:hypothetical protein
MSIIWESIKVCRACEDDIAESGKTLCSTCAAFQLSLRLADAVKAVPYRVRPLPWDFFDKTLGAIGGGLIVATRAMWESFQMSRTKMPSHSCAGTARAVDVTRQAARSVAGWSREAAPNQNLHEFGQLNVCD